MRILDLVVAAGVVEVAVVAAVEVDAILEIILLRGTLAGRYDRAAGGRREKMLLVISGRVARMKAMIAGTARRNA